MVGSPARSRSVSIAASQGAVCGPCSRNDRVAWQGVVLGQDRRDRRRWPGRSGGHGGQPDNFIGAQKRATSCSPSPAFRKANGNRSAPRMQTRFDRFTLRDCTKSSNGGSRRRPCPLREPPPCCFGRSWHQILCGRAVAFDRVSWPIAPTQGESKMTQFETPAPRCAAPDYDIPRFQS